MLTAAPSSVLTIRSTTASPGTTMGRAGGERVPVAARRGGDDHRVAAVDSQSLAVHADVHVDGTAGQGATDDDIVQGLEGLAPGRDAGLEHGPPLPPTGAGQHAGQVGHELLLDDLGPE